MNAKLAALLDVIKSTGRRVVPVDQGLIKGNVSTHVNDMLAQIKDNGGFSFNPRTGKFLKGGDDFGYMMSTVPEMPGVNRVPVNQPDLDKVIANLMDDPYYADRLASGQYLGGWMDGGDLVLDPSQRFINKNRSIIRGNDLGNQMAGFDVAGMSQYDLTPQLVEQARQEALKRALMLAIGIGGGAVGTGAALGMDNQ